MTSFCLLPRLNARGDGFVSIDECQQMQDEGDSLKVQLKDLYKVRKDYHKDDNELEQKRKSDGKLSKITNWSKLRRVLKCACGTSCCVFS